VANLVGDLEQRLVKALGLETPESTLAWLEQLGELTPDEPRLVAIEGPELPEYYDGDMKLDCRLSIPARHGGVGNCRLADCLRERRADVDRHSARHPQLASRDNSRSTQGAAF
jgi:hypothetical protein